ncbi:MAG: phosphatidylglycerol lysyltransferase domain-containing protein [Chloroflexota bacterium]
MRSCNLALRDYLLKLGAITLSAINPEYVHTEMILRHHKATSGVMEALITTIAQQLSEEGVRQFSLGNVTPLPLAGYEAVFGSHHHENELWLQSQVAFRLGRAFNFAYNASGLWHFKNKFSPRWEPLYLCASSRLSWLTIIGLVQAMGYFDLVRHRLVEMWPISLLSLKGMLPQLDTLLPIRL